MSSFDHRFDKGILILTSQKFDDFFFVDDYFDVYIARHAVTVDKEMTDQQEASQDVYKLNDQFSRREAEKLSVNNNNVDDDDVESSVDDDDDFEPPPKKHRKHPYMLAETLADYFNVWIRDIINSVKGDVVTYNGVTYVPMSTACDVFKIYPLPKPIYISSDSEEETDDELIPPPVKFKD